jgi:hypothetical protein
VARPKLSAAVTWKGFEEAVLAVFRDALRRLADRAQLPKSEEPINLALYWLAREVHLEKLKSPQGSIPFSVLFDSTSQPEPDDVARASRLRKRPDFNCVLTNPQAPDHYKSQANYYLECKRLGQAEGSWVLNENYSEHGINRFVHPDWQYAKGCASGAMIGYLQNMTPDDVLNEVNTFASARSLPSLSRAAASWAAKNVTPLSQPALSRTVQPNPFTLGHLWIDLCHCQFTASAAPAAKQPAAKKPKKKKAAAKKKPATKTAVKKKKTP